MKNKLLIWEQHYDVVHHIEIIDRADLEAYVIHWTAKFLHDANSRGNILYRYVSHKIEEHHEVVNIKFEHLGYQAGQTAYPGGEYWGGFKFIELEKISTWKP
jgi:hypothetical protein